MTPIPSPASASSLALSLLFATLSTSVAEVRPASLFQSGMVLQQGMAIPVWGTGDPGEKITVTFAGQTQNGKTDQNGKWFIQLAPLTGTTRGSIMKITGENKITLKDVVVGEVWICSGQSNMKMETAAIPEIKALIPKAKQLRVYEVPRAAAFTEQENCGGKWEETHPSSAVAFSFAHFLQKAAGLPVGIIHASWGSSSLEAWMPRDMAETVPHFAKIMSEFDRDQKTRTALQTSFDKPQKWSRHEDVFIRRQPNILYNAMIKPLAPFACRGLVWYQGERNAQSMAGMVKSPWYGRHSGVLRYGDTLKKWIQRYRTEWKQEDMQFMVVMLPGYGKVLPTGPKVGAPNQAQSPIAHSWAWMREQQLTVLDLPHTTVINTIDLGDLKNIHPKDKLPIGKRLALAAAKNTLGKKIIANGPTFQKVTTQGRALIVHFDHADGLTTEDQKAPTAFWIADDSKNWFRADAQIKGNQITLSADKADSPKYVRYAFAGLPEVNLVNAAGLPARPFRTDSFKP